MILYPSHTQTHTRTGVALTSPHTAHRIRFAKSFQPMCATRQDSQESNHPKLGTAGDTTAGTLSLRSPRKGHSMVHRPKQAPRLVQRQRQRQRKQQQHSSTLAAALAAAAGEVAKAAAAAVLAAPGVNPAEAAAAAKAAVARCEESYMYRGRAVCVIHHTGTKEYPL